MPIYPECSALVLNSTPSLISKFLNQKGWLESLGELYQHVDPCPSLPRPT